MSKYTPGPWEWGEDKDGGPGIIHAGETLVVNFPWKNCNEPADARLIAAAPDLLTALETMVGEYACSSDECEFCAPARAAIAKAKQGLPEKDT